MKLRDAPDASLIAAYIKIRDARAKRKSDFESADAVSIPLFSGRITDRGLAASPA